MKLGHVSTVPRRWQGWRTSGPTFPLTVILTKPIDRTLLAEREKLAVESDDDE